MAKLTSEQVSSIARLAKINLSDEEKNSLRGELSAILDFVDELNEVDVTGVAPTSQVTGLVDQWRVDEVKKCELSRDELLANAHSVQAGFVKVKRVIAGE